MVLLWMPPVLVIQISRFAFRKLMLPGVGSHVRYPEGSCNISYRPPALGYLFYSCYFEFFLDNADEL